MYSVNGKLLAVDLTKRSCAVEDIPSELFREYLGGYGLGVRLLLERMDPKADPLGPGNILGVAAGYLTGTGAYIASRYMVFGKSPTTKGWGDANCGGHFGKKLKNAGFDVLLFSGQADKPVYLLIEDGKAQLEDASGLWGRDTYETEDRLKDKHGKDCEVICIGPAGERLSAIGGISTDKGRFAARSGLGSVMGSKKLKAVVAKGKRPIALARPEKMQELRKKHLGVFKEGLGELLSKYGTPMFYDSGLPCGDTPWKNWSSSAGEMPSYSTNADKVVSFQEKRYACDGCPVGCGGHVKVERGDFRTNGLVHKVEYETMGIFGPNLLLDSAEALIRINDLCNRYGMDTIGCGGLCGYAIECYERGLITKDQTGGLELRWGDGRAIAALVEKIGKGEGIGGVLSKGFEEAVRVYGAQTAQYAMAVRGEGLPAHDPRWNAGLALTYYFDPTPARHTQGSTTYPVAGYSMPEIPAAQAGGRAKHHNENVNWTHVLNSAGLCLFGYIILDYKTLPDFLEAADGARWTHEELSETGLRITLARQLFNVRAGQTLDRYDFPKRVLGDPPLETGATKGVRVDLAAMVSEYLQEMGWDAKTGLPGKEVLKRLKLDRYYR